MTSSDQVKAGEYELVALSWDEPTSKPGEPFEFKRHVKGDVVTLNAEEARRLVAAGAVVEPGSLERAEYERALAAYEAAKAALPAEPAAPRRRPAEPFPAAGSDDEQTEWIAKATIPVVAAAAEQGDDELRAALLAAELRRGSDARPTLLDKLAPAPQQ